MPQPDPSNHLCTEQVDSRPPCSEVANHTNSRPRSAAAIANPGFHATSQTVRANQDEATSSATLLIARSKPGV
jgi:hypothetical protein